MALINIGRYGQAVCGLLAAAWVGATLGASAAPTGLDENGHLMAVDSSGNKEFSMVQLENGVQLCIGDRVKNVIFYAPATVRINENLGKNYWEHPSIVVEGKPAAVPFQVKETGGSITITSDQLQIKADKATGALTFMDASGQVLTKERADQPSEIKPVVISGAPSYEVANTFTLKPKEGWYGFGLYRLLAGGDQPSW